MSTISDAPETHAPAPCEAERRIMRTLYEMEIDWGAGTFDYAKIRGILTGRDTERCDHQTD